MVIWGEILYPLTTKKITFATISFTIKFVANKNSIGRNNLKIVNMQINANVRYPTARIRRELAKIKHVIKKSKKDAKMVVSMVSNEQVNDDHLPMYFF